MIVFEKKEIREGCSNCLYRGSDGIHCGHANNQGRLMIMVNGGRACGSYWLDQNRFQEASITFGSDGGWK